VCERERERENKCWNIIPYFSKYSSANEEHLYGAISEEFRATYPEMHRDLSLIMYSWTRQASYPLVTVTSDGNQLTITQVPILLSGLI
jgi:aminopeptidase N